MKNIFVVEDDPMIALDIKSILQKNNYNVAGHLDNGEEAVIKIPEIKPDLILMDINLKGKMDGIETASILNDKIDCPLIFLTALSDEETLSRAKLVRPFGYVVKPFEEADIVTSIEIAFARFEDDSAEHTKEDTLPEFDNISTDSKLSAEQLSSLPIFAELDKKQISLLTDSSAIKTYSAGDILSTGNSKDGFIVLSGRVGIISTTLNGKDLITELLGPGDCYGLYFLFPQVAEKIYAKAQAESKVLSVSKDVFKHLMESSMRFNANMIESLILQLSKNISIAQALAYSKVEDRIINALLALLPSFGKKVVGLENAGRLFITRKELADFTGTTPETAIRVTKSLERRGFLDLTKPGIIKVLDTHKLREEICE